MRLRLHSDWHSHFSCLRVGSVSRLLFQLCQLYFYFVKIRSLFRIKLPSLYKIISVICVIYKIYKFKKKNHHARKKLVKEWWYLPGWMWIRKKTLFKKLAQLKLQYLHHSLTQTCRQFFTQLWACDWVRNQQIQPIKTLHFTPQNLFKRIRLRDYKNVKVVDND